MGLDGIVSQGTDLFNGRGAFHAAVKTHRKGGLALIKGAGAERLERVEKTLSA